jgi:ketosteroid isomerase-like protein
MDHEQNPADVYSPYLKAFNAADIGAILACYVSQACFLTRSGRAARGAAECAVYRVTFSNKPQMQFNIRKATAAQSSIGANKRDCDPCPLKATCCLNMAWRKVPREFERSRTSRRRQCAVTGG